MYFTYFPASHNYSSGYLGSCHRGFDHTKVMQVMHIIQVMQVMHIIQVMQVMHIIQAM